MPVSQHEYRRILGICYATLSHNRFNSTEIDSVHMPSVIVSQALFDSTGLDLVSVPWVIMSQARFDSTGLDFVSVPWAIMSQTGVHSTGLDLVTVPWVIMSQTAPVAVGSVSLMTRLNWLFRQSRVGTKRNQFFWTSSIRKQVAFTAPFMSDNPHRLFVCLPFFKNCLCSQTAFLIKAITFRIRLKCVCLFSRMRNAVAFCVA